MKLLYIPNEHHEGYQSGPRRAFSRLSQAGVLAGCETYPMDFNTKRLGSFDVAFAELMGRAAALQPDIVLWQHVERLPVTHAHLVALKALPSRPTLVYQEMDAYGVIRKRLTKSTILLAREADLVYLCGLGSLHRMFAALGASEIRYIPHGVDFSHFGRLPDSDDRAFDVVMLGTRITSKWPGMRMPGSRTRQKLAEALYDVYGERFGAFGRNWGRAPFNCGEVPFADQTSVIHQAQVTVGWDHFPTIPYYFSDRLPIALAAGVPHVTNYQPGYDELFATDVGLSWGHNVDEVVQEVENLMQLTPLARANLGRNGHQFVADRLDQNRQYEWLLDDIRTFRRLRQSAR